ncbi:MAG: iron-containing alcohol dehydrogenase, partial [Thaumarchaeota archaeon]|nr:iron-containing alcohol dehydrogenase [Nitrososphaerota archaeon]
MMVVGTSRPASGSEHLISHYLDMNLKERLPHGIQCALGALPMAAYHELRNPNWWRDERYRLTALRGYFHEVGLPTSLRETRVPIEVMVNAIVEAWRIRPNRYTILHKFKPDRSEALKLLKISGLA